MPDRSVTTAHPDTQRGVREWKGPGQAQLDPRQAQLDPQQPIMSRRTRLPSVENPSPLSCVFVFIVSSLFWPERLCLRSDQLLPTKTPLTLPAHSSTDLELCPLTWWVQSRDPCVPGPWGTTVDNKSNNSSGGCGGVGVRKSNLRVKVFGPESTTRPS